MAFDSERFEERRLLLSRLSVPKLRDIARRCSVNLSGAVLKEDVVRALSYELTRREGR
ncbi:MAG: hypothetical protein SOY67_02690 [Collinsella sp.]|nr:hypothetical protein [Collinsella sp.]